MDQLGKWLTFAGLGLALVGVVLWGLAKLGFRGLPGDVRYESENVRVYVPIVTCIVISAIATVAVWIWQSFRK